MTKETIEQAAKKIRGKEMADFAIQIHDEALDEAMQACFAERVDAGATGDEGDKIYNRAIRDCFAAIRALKVKP